MLASTMLCKCPGLQNSCLSCHTLRVQVKLKDLVIASYIPRGQQRRIMLASAWDAVQQCWRIAFADVGDGPADAPRCVESGFRAEAGTGQILREGTVTWVRQS